MLESTAEETESSRPIAGRDELVDYFRAACKPRERWRLGTEHELIGISTADGDFGDAVPYHGERGIRALFDRLERRGWQPVMEGDKPIAMARGEEQITLEPGGQIELAGAPVTRTDTYRDDVSAFLAEVTEASEELQLAWLCAGFRPFQRLEEVPWVPKGRYGIMREYLPTRGGLAHEMMKRTATVQLNVDYADADDARSKLRASFSATSILTALYANSPIVDEKPSGFQSYRSYVWRDTDPDRCGFLHFVFDESDVFESYTDWALDVPMFFVQRDGYLPARGATFRSFLHEGFEGHAATLDDWALHLSTLFPEARMKGYIEVRSCDAGTPGVTLALGPLLRGLLYDADAREGTIALTAGLDADERDALALDVARRGLAAVIPGSGRRVADAARELLALSRDGLRRLGSDEAHYLEPLEEIAESERTLADQTLELWHAEGGDRRAVAAALTHRPLP